MDSNVQRFSQMWNISSLQLADTLRLKKFRYQNRSQKHMMSKWLTAGLLQFVCHRKNSNCISYDSFSLHYLIEQNPHHERYKWLCMNKNSILQEHILWKGNVSVHLEDTNVTLLSFTHTEVKPQNTNVDPDNNRWYSRTALQHSWAVYAPLIVNSDRTTPMDIS